MIRNKAIYILPFAAAGFASCGTGVDEQERPNIIFYLDPPYYETSSS